MADMNNPDEVKVKQKSIASNLKFNDSELEYIYAQISHRIASLSSSMSLTSSERLTCAESDLISNQKQLVDDFTNWYWEGKPCPECDGIGYNGASNE